eukprot:TRINITY_DN10412_c0_g1_i1.p1 TRINITY_DN10412_c0_g1~~TRINITY_DN10412_c0_g1_i1.p1  ORF type:complete len:207 (-),score=3.81 TRINITY_DN10412_c0_g1_i1:101-721(-)
MARCANDKIELSVFDSEKYFGWKDGVLVFKGANIDEVISALERWYDVSVQVVDKELITGKFEGTYSNKSLDVVMEGISYTSKFTYTIENKNLTIIGKHQHIGKPQCSMPMIQNIFLRFKFLQFNFLKQRSIKSKCRQFLDGESAFTGQIRPVSVFYLLKTTQKYEMEINTTNFYYVQTLFLWDFCPMSGRFCIVSQQRKRPESQHR